MLNDAIKQVIKNAVSKYISTIHDNIDSVSHVELLNGAIARKELPLGLVEIIKTELQETASVVEKELFAELYANQREAYSRFHTMSSAEITRKHRNKRQTVDDLIVSIDKQKKLEEQALLEFDAPPPQKHNYSCPYKRNYHWYIDYLTNISPYYQNGLKDYIELSAHDTKWRAFVDYKIHCIGRLINCQDLIQTFETQLKIQRKELNKYHFAEQFKHLPKEATSEGATLLGSYKNLFKSKQSKNNEFFSYDLFSKEELGFAFNEFLIALKPEIQYNSCYAASLKKIGVLADLQHCQTQVITILDRKKITLGLADSNADKRSRIDNLKKAIEAYQPTIDSKKQELVQIINDWQNDVVNGRYNEEVFHTNACISLFSSTPGHQFIYNCLAILQSDNQVTDYQFQLHYGANKAFIK